jgi:uncharacterized membrane protein
MTIGFLALLASMMLFLASSTEKKFYNIVKEIYEIWQQQRRELNIGTEEYKRRMETMEKLLPNTQTLRRIMNMAMVAIVTGIAIYSYSLVSMYKGWLRVKPGFYLLIISAFLFIYGGFSSYYANKKLTDSMRNISKYLQTLITQ